jgi:hypothetical protein
MVSVRRGILPGDESSAPESEGRRLRRQGTIQRLAEESGLKSIRVILGRFREPQAAPPPSAAASYNFL